MDLRSADVCFRNSLRTPNQRLWYRTRDMHVKAWGSLRLSPKCGWNTAVRRCFVEFLWDSFQFTDRSVLGILCRVSIRGSKPSMPKEHLQQDGQIGISIYSIYRRWTPQGSGGISTASCSLASGACCRQDLQLLFRLRGAGPCKRSAPWISITIITSPASLYSYHNFIFQVYKGQHPNALAFKWFSHVESVRSTWISF